MLLRSNSFYLHQPHLFMQIVDRGFTLKLFFFTTLMVLMVLVAEGLDNNQARKAETGPEKDVRQAVERFVESLNNLDWEKFPSCFAEDATMFFPSLGLGRRVSGRDEIIALFKFAYEDVPKQDHGPPYLHIEPKEIKIQMLVDAAIVTFHRDDDRTLNRRTLIFQKQKDKWLIVHLHASNIELQK